MSPSSRNQSPECQAAVARLIELITSAPVLAAPRAEKEFIVKTDAASSLGIGGILSKADDHGPRWPITDGG